MFDPYVKVETRISGDLGSMRNEAQLSDIMAEAERIKGFTWHHHQEIGKMQLVPRDIHEWIKHIGGNKLWGIPK